jgi:hypothetical protein
LSPNNNNNNNLTTTIHDDDDDDDDGTSIVLLLPKNKTPKSAVNHIYLFIYLQAAPTFDGRSISLRRVFFFSLSLLKVNDNDDERRQL